MGGYRYELHNLNEDLIQKLHTSDTPADVATNLKSIFSFLNSTKIWKPLASHFTDTPPLTPLHMFYIITRRNCMFTRVPEL